MRTPSNAQSRPRAAPHPHACGAGRTTSRSAAPRVRAPRRAAAQHRHVTTRNERRFWRAKPRKLPRAVTASGAGMEGASGSARTLKRNPWFPGVPYAATRRSAGHRLSTKAGRQPAHAAAAPTWAARVIGEGDAPKGARRRAEPFEPERRVGCLASIPGPRAGLPRVLLPPIIERRGRGHPRRRAPANPGKDCHERPAGTCGDPRRGAA